MKRSKRKSILFRGTALALFLMVGFSVTEVRAAGKGVDVVRRLARLPAEWQAGEARGEVGAGREADDADLAGQDAKGGGLGADQPHGAGGG